ncbi:PQQ-binding-like beta-propeller repeat protein [Zavarzinella formosa]|uniref:PQQ-binding-like beta-propeller repeat protein n=1 Tax=Zavarzinella formosa TaxID=360055 RepID=UPI0002F937CC|nr:PQQ-binding-like beta-propeller repeat protein [Zavarzinella formosa]
MSSIQLAALLLSLSAPAPKDGGNAGDWPQWRGPNRDDVSKETGLLKEWPSEGPKLLWKTEKCGVGYGSPVTSAGKIFLMGGEDSVKGANEFLLCLDAKEGQEVWRKPLNTAEGNYNHGWGSGPRGTPTVDGDKVYVLGAKGDLQCYETKDGTLVWAKNLVKDFLGEIPVWGYSESILIDGDKLLVTPGGKAATNKGAVACLNKTNGTVVWRSTEYMEPAGYSSIVITEVDGIKQYVQQSAQSVVGLSVEGKVLWRRADIGYKVAVIPTPVVYKNYVFVTAGYGAGCSLIRLAKDGAGIKAEMVYKNKSIVNHHGGVIRVGEFVYGHSDSGGWVCLDFLKSTTADGPEPTWTSKKLDKGTVTYADGSFYLFGEGKGTVVKIAATPTEWKEEGRFELPAKSQIPRRDGKLWAHPVVSNGKLYIRDHEVLMCFDIAAK